jgi:hypothetical protein
VTAPQPMSAGLRRALTLTDGLMLGYWALTALVAVHLLRLPPDALYKGYDQPALVAWNWSFMPIDIAFSVTGLSALRRSHAGRPWHGLAIVSLTLTMCAGAMAIGFWALFGDFDAGWWIPNLLLLFGPLIWLPGIVRKAE